VFSWTGFYVGIDGGFGGGVVDADTVFVQPSITVDGFTVAHRTGLVRDDTSSLGLRPRPLPALYHRPVSYGQVTASGSQLVLGAAGTVFGSASRTHAGWTAGAGAEYAVTDNISLKAEYLFVQLDGVSGSEVGFAPPVVGSFKTGTLGTHIVRAGLNWRFGGFGAGPVVATY
jgi:outer membrane immunogenic protein